MRQFSPQEISQLRYNLERMAQDEFAKRTLDREGLIDAIHRNYLREIESKINNFYLKYAESEGIPIRVAKARADSMDVALFADKARQAVLDKDFSPYTNEWLKVYNLKMKVSREELLKYNIEYDLYQLTKENEAIMLNGMGEEYRLELERQAGILGNSVPPDMGKRIENLVDADFYGSPFSEKVWGRNGRYDTISREVFRSMGNIQGQLSDYKKEVRRLQDVFGTSKYESYRLMRTETRRFNAEAQSDSYKDNGFTHYIYVAEAGACLLCASLDQTAIPVDEIRMGDNYPTKHPNCRCSTYGVIEMHRRSSGMSNIDEHNEKYGTYEDALKDLDDIAKGKIKEHGELRNKSKDYLDLSYSGYSRNRATHKQATP